MAPQRPLPVVDVSSHGFIACLATAGRSHVGNYQPHERPRTRGDAQHRALAAEPGRRCLYCGARDPVGGEEHVLSVALGNWFWVLPPNVVCSRCNSGVLSTLDTALLRHPLIASVRALADIRGRAGQPATAAASNMRFARDRDGTLNVEVDHARYVVRDGDRVTLNAKWANHGPRQRRDTARALLKLGLGLLWLGRGPEETDQLRYDHVRRAIAGDKNVPLRHGFENSVLPSHALSAQAVSHEQARGLWVGLDYFGVHLWADTDGIRADVSPEFLAAAV